MRLIIRAIVAVCPAWIGLLMSGWRHPVGSKVNAGWLTVPLPDRTRHQRAISPYLNSGIIGFSDCPIFRKIATVVG
ncbi:hypothetical protein KCP69_17425 [Salmonella enterica subsp. enterica]|nr:hypothetical protein KCP69_17425 [Salmonella enterica subsp. enterica]